MIHILFVNTWFHHKNLEALNKYKQISYDTITSIEDLHGLELTKYDCVYSPTHPIDVSQFPNVKFLFGPHFACLPDQRFEMIKGENSAYVMSSEWWKSVFESYPITAGLKFVTLPFGVDTTKYCETIPCGFRELVFIYYKYRAPADLEFIETFLQQRGIPYTIFSYYKRYDETSYRTFLQHAKYGVWVGGHETQGFALQEALACNVPLLVWSVTSMKQEWGSSYEDAPATTVPYWDERCGEVFYHRDDFERTYQRFIERLDCYKPREYIIENLSCSVCEKQLLNVINSL